MAINGQYAELAQKCYVGEVGSGSGDYISFFFPPDNECVWTLEARSRREREWRTGAAGTRFRVVAEFSRIPKPIAENDGRAKTPATHSAGSISDH